MGTDVFISYARKDIRQVEELVDFLTDAGVSVWIDRAGIDGAAKWSQEIVRAIGRSRVVVVIATRASFASDNVHREVHLAYTKRKPILPLYLEQVTVPEEIEYELARIQHLKMFHGDWQANLRAVLNSLKKAGVKVEDVPRPDSSEYEESPIVIPDSAADFREIQQAVDDGRGSEDDVACAYVQLYARDRYDVWAEEAGSGSAWGQCLVGYCHRLGVVVPRGEQESFEWYRKAAEQGLALAQYQMWQAYEHGTVVEANTQTAARWMRRAARSGNVQARQQVGEDNRRQRRRRLAELHASVVRSGNAVIRSPLTFNSLLKRLVNGDEYVIVFRFLQLALYVAVPLLLVWIANRLW